MERRRKMTLQAVLLAVAVVFLIFQEVPGLTNETGVKRAVAAGNPYPASQDVDGDGLYEVPCTRFAWQQVYDNSGIALPGWGNAVNWWNNAKNAGYATGNEPKAGSIAVWSGDVYGHVAYVVSGAGNTFTVNEGGRTDLDQTASHGVKYGYTLTNAVGGRRPKDTGKTLLGFIYPANVDTEAPVISNVRVENIDSTGYTVLCDVTDNVGVVKVQFPSWPAYKQAEGCPWLEDHYEGNTFICRVKYADFGNYTGLYNTVIYAWDAAGNSTHYDVVNANDKTKYVANYTKADFIGNNKQVIVNIIRNQDKKYVTIKNDGYLTTANRSGGADQNWVLKNNGDGTVSICSEKTGKYIGVYGGGKVNGTKLDTAVWNGTTPQRWIIYKDDDGTCYLRPSHVTNQVMDTGGDNGTTLHLWDFGRHAVHQTFQISVVSAQPAATAAPVVTPQATVSPVVNPTAAPAEPAVNNIAYRWKGNIEFQSGVVKVNTLDMEKNLAYRTEGTSFGLTLSARHDWDGDKLHEACLVINGATVESTGFQKNGLKNPKIYVVAEPISSTNSSSVSMIRKWGTAENGWVSTNIFEAKNIKGKAVYSGSLAEGDLCVLDAPYCRVSEIVISEGEVPTTYFGVNSGTSESTAPSASPSVSASPAPASSSEPATVAVPSRVTGVSAKNAKGKKLVVSWIWKAGVSGFEVDYALNQSFTKGKQTRQVGSYTDAVSFKVQKGKKYYVRVRAYNLNNGEKRYGSWSVVKSVKIKK